MWTESLLLTWLTEAPSIKIISIEQAQEIILKYNPPEVQNPKKG